MCLWSTWSVCVWATPSLFVSLRFALQNISQDMINLLDNGNIRPHAAAEKLSKSDAAPHVLRCLSLLSSIIGAEQRNALEGYLDMQREDILNILLAKLISSKKKDRAVHTISHLSKDQSTSSDGMV